MNILFHCWEYPPRGSGIGQYVYHMSRALRLQGCFVVVVTSYGDSGPSDEVLDNGIIYRLYQLKDIGKPWVAEKIEQLCRKHKIDWLEGADHLGESAPFLAMQGQNNTTIKAHYNDVLKIARYAHVYYPWQKILVDIACFRDSVRLTRERKSLVAANVLTAPSRRILDEMKDQQIPLSPKMAVIPNPITPVTGWANKEAPCPTLLLVGRIDIGKGIEFLPGLVQSLSRYFPDLVIEVAGGDSFARLLGSTKKWLIRKMGSHQKYLRFLGELDREALDRAYARAWVVIVPSKWDTFPTVVLEAMARSKPIVASGNGGMAEMLSGTDCRIANPAEPEFSEAVADFLENKKKRETAGRTAQERAIQAYSPERVARNYLDLLVSC